MKTIDIKNTKQEVKETIQSIVLDLSDSILPEVENYELANFDVKLHLDCSLHGKEYVQISFSWNIPKTKIREHDEIIQFCITDDGKSLVLLEEEHEAILENSNLDSIWKVTDFLYEIIETNQFFKNIAIPEILESIRLSKINGLVDNSAPKTKVFKSLGKLEKHFHLHGLIHQFRFNNQTYNLFSQCKLDKITIFKSENSKSQILVSTTDFNSVVGYRDARVQLA